LPNAASGISLLSGAHNNGIGDPAPSLQNVIGSTTNPFSAGIFVADPGTSSNIISGNIVGSPGFPNSYGVYVTNSAANNFISSNAITLSTHAGVAIVGNGATGNAITDNQIFSNGGLGIDLGNDGVTTNDFKDVDTGPNNLQNYPVLRNVVIGSNSVTLTAQLNSTPNQSFEVTLYRSDHCDAGGFGEGQVVLGKVTIGADANGDAGVSGLNYAVPNSLTQPSWGTAIVRSLATQDTSEFSRCVGISDEIYGDGFNTLPGPAAAVDADGSAAAEEASN
jgi:hypothetical protein